MAFDPSLLNTIVAPVGGNAIRFFSYTTDDTQAAVTGVGYFVRADRAGLKTSDLIIVSPLNRAFEPYLVTLADISASGNGTATLEARTAKIRTPFDYGAPPNISSSEDASVYVQAMFDDVRASYSTAVGDFTLIADLAGRDWRIETGLNLTELRQPGIIVQNGTLYGACGGKIVLDLAGTNSPILRNLMIYGDRTNPPAVGLLLSRAKIGGVMAAVPNARMFDVQTSGHFTKSAFVNIAAEVTSQYGCWWRNYSRSLTAYSYVHVGHAKTLDDYIGGLTSDYTTLPVAADGAMSNILHYLGQPHILREADLALPITSITKANPAVVTVDAASLTAAGLSNGAAVYFHQVTGMTQLNGNVYTVANVNLGAGTFELSGTNSTGYGTFAGGFVWNQTGPAILLNACDGMTGRSGYFLTYGSTGIVVDHVNGGWLREVDLEFSLEAQPPSMIRFDKPGTGSVVQGMRLKNLSTGQSFSDCIVDDTGAGTIRFDNLELKISNMGTAPPNNVFKNPSKIILQNSTIEVPLSAALNSLEGFTSGAPTGRFIAYDRTPQVHWLGTFQLVEGNAGASAGPVQQLIRYSSTPADGDAGGSTAFIQNDSAGNLVTTLQLRARMVTSTAGSVNGRFEIVYPVAGVETLAFFAQADGFYYGPTQHKLFGARKTGWAPATGTATRTTFNTATVTLEELAQRVKALIDDLHATAGHGLIGT